MKNQGIFDFLFEFLINLSVCVTHSFNEWNFSTKYRYLYWMNSNRLANWRALCKVDFKKDVNFSLSRSLCDLMKHIRSFLETSEGVQPNEGAAAEAVDDVRVKAKVLLAALSLSISFSHLFAFIWFNMTISNHVLWFCMQNCGILEISDLWVKSVAFWGFFVEKRQCLCELFIQKIQKSTEKSRLPVKLLEIEHYLKKWTKNSKRKHVPEQKESIVWKTLRLFGVLFFHSLSNETSPNSLTLQITKGHWVFWKKLQVWLYKCKKWKKKNYFEWLEKCCCVSCVLMVDICRK